MTIGVRVMRYRKRAEVPADFTGVGIREVSGWQISLPYTAWYNGRTVQFCETETDARIFLLKEYHRSRIL